MITDVLATNVVIKMDNVVLGCAQSATFSTKMEMTDTTCSATAGFKKQVPGTESWDGSISAIVRVFDTTSAATNISVKDMYAKLRAKAPVDVEYEIGGLTGYTFTSKAYLTNVDISIPEGSGVVTWTANLVGAEPLTVV